MDKNRRGFMTWLGGFLGLGVFAAPAIAAVPKKLEGFIVFFVNIGSLPPFKAEAFIERLKEKWKKDRNVGTVARTENVDLIANWQVFWIPTRTDDTHAEFYPLNGEKDVEGKLKMVEGMLLDYEDKVGHPGASIDIDDPMMNLRVVDYVCLMLGAPVKPVDQSQVECAYDNVVEHIKTTGNALNSMHMTENFVKEGTLAWSKMFVGRQRITAEQGSDEALAFYEEGRDEVTDWTAKLEEMM